MPMSSSSKQSGGGEPSNETLVQFLMLTKGLNREGATEEVMADPDKIKEQFQKVKQLVEGGGNGGEGAGAKPAEKPSWDKK